MDNRYDRLAKAGVANLDEYNKKTDPNIESKMPRLVILIDELNDLMLVAREKVENAIVRIAQLARAVGIHLILGTQRPSVDVITGVIKANLPTRIAFSVNSGVDSRVILDSSGAENLLGKGDMLYLSPSSPAPERLQGCFISRDEIERVVEYLKSIQSPERIEINIAREVERSESASVSGDEMYKEAIKIVIKYKKASISLLQRKLSIGYNRAAKIIDSMEENGIVGEERGTKGREILISKEID
ncbi:DNA translocase FtsK, partial [Elusimicrobiota bacterium]